MTVDSSAAPHGPHHAELLNDDGSWKYTNALIDETSPYLLQHAHNPVDWLPWGEEAFAKARAEQKLVFLSVGYATCYWCHVMERQVFEDPELAEQINTLFVPVKVDREERPDVDDIYMTATQLLTRGGGWPMNVFLTPPAPEGIGEEDSIGYGLKPFWAGTYIPPRMTHGRPGFDQMATGLARAWEFTRPEVLKQAQLVADAVSEQMAHARTAGPVDAASVQRSADLLMRLYDPAHGGFAGPDGPKFPTPSHVDFLLSVYKNNGVEPVWDAVAFTLDAMAYGGMYDQIGGGFHRYSTDERWLVPHFEKMLYDNGALLSLYSRAYRMKPDARSSALYRRVVAQTAAYLEREMTDATGAFWSAQDAEVDGFEGGNYVWTADQVREVFVQDPALRDLTLEMYGLTRGTNFTDPHVDGAEPVNVLFMPRPLSELEPEFAPGDMAGLSAKRRQINAAMLAVRDRRNQPITDDKVLTAWNGLAIAGLAEAFTVFDEPAYRETATRAADAVLEHLGVSAPGDDGERRLNGLKRTMRDGRVKVPGFLEDYAFVIQGLLALHAAEPDAKAAQRWLTYSQQLAEVAEANFSATGGGYYDTLEGQGDLFVRGRSGYDGAVPTGNSQMLHNLVALYEATEDERYLDRAVRLARSWATPLSEGTAGLLHMQHGVLRLMEAAPPSFREQLAAPPTGPVGTDVVTAGVAVDDAATGRYLVTVRVAEGYHVNANPPSMENLIPVSVEPGDVTYPEGHDVAFAFSPDPLRVYAGEFQLRVTLDPEALPEALTLRYQACNDTACLPPKTLHLALP